MAGDSINYVYGVHWLVETAKNEPLAMKDSPEKVGLITKNYFKMLTFFCFKEHPQKRFQLLW